MGFGLRVRARASVAMVACWAHLQASCGTSLENTKRTMTHLVRGRGRGRGRAGVRARVGVGVRVGAKVRVRVTCWEREPSGALGRTKLLPCEAGPARLVRVGVRVRMRVGVRVKVRGRVKAEGEG